MAFRTFNPGYQSIAVTNTAQPLISTTLAAAVSAQSDASREQILQVAASGQFRVGDWLVVDINALEDRVLIGRIPDATHIALAPNNGCKLAHANAALVRLSIIASSVYVQTLDGNTNPLFIGSSVNSKNTGVLCRAKLQAVVAGMQPTDWRDAFTSDSGSNPIDVAEIWIVGTATDQYLPSFGVV